MPKNFGLTEMDNNLPFCEKDEYSMIMIMIMIKTLNLSLTMSLGLNVMAFSCPKYWYL